MQELQIGDLVEWKGIRVVVVELLPDGSVKAVNKTLMVHTTRVDDLVKVD